MLYVIVTLVGLTLLAVLISQKRTEKFMVTNAQALADLNDAVGLLAEQVDQLGDADVTLQEAILALEVELAANSSAGPSISPTVIENVVAKLKGASQKMSAVVTSVAAQAAAVGQDAANQAPPPAQPPDNPPAEVPPAV